MRRAGGVLLAGAALTLLAFLFDAAPLFVPGVALVLLACLSTAWVSAAAAAARIERGSLPGRVIEGEQIDPQLRCSGGPLGLPGARVLDSAATELLASPPRGLHRIAPPALVLSDPLALAMKCKRAAGGDQQLLVLPRTERVRWLAAGAGRPAEGARTRAHTEAFAAVDIEGLRPYQPGTPASRIHWPALARGAGLLERRLEPDGDQLPLVVLDTRGEGHREQLDAAVRAAASLILEFALAGGCRALLPGERRQVLLGRDLLAWHQLHARLAVLEGGSSAPAPALGAHSSATEIIYVAARAISRVPPGFTRGARGCMLVLPAELAPAAAAQTHSFEVGGCYGFSVRSAAQRRAA